MRVASCRCGGLVARCEGDPLRVSVCHCLECQRRTGSAFAVQARFRKDVVTLDGTYMRWERIGESGDKATYFFCPTCGSTVFYENESLPDVVAIPVGAFADPDFPIPERSIFERRRHIWVEVIGTGIQHHLNEEAEAGCETFPALHGSFGEDR